MAIKRDTIIVCHVNHTPRTGYWRSINKNQQSKVMRHLLYYIISLTLLFQGCLCNAATNRQQEIADVIETDKDGIITVTEENYEFLKKNSLQSQFSVLYLTVRTLDDEGTPKCKVCHDFEKTYRKAVSSMLSMNLNVSVSYYIVDVSEVKTLVKNMGLKSVPHLVVYPPSNDEKEETHSWETAPFYPYQLTAREAKNTQRVIEFLAGVLGVDIKSESLRDKVVRFSSEVFSIYLVLSKLALPILRRPGATRYVFAVVLTGFIVLCISGAKFAQMNKVSFIARDKNNQPVFFVGGFRYQIGIEVFAVSLLYVIFTLLVVLLIFIKESSWLESILDGNDKVSDLLAGAVGCLIFIMFGYYRSCYEIKMPGYPY